MSALSLKDATESLVASLLCYIPKLQGKGKKEKPCALKIAAHSKTVD